MISADHARGWLQWAAQGHGGQLLLQSNARGLAETVVAQAEQIAAARDTINDLQGWGLLPPQDADRLLAILKDQP